MAANFLENFFESFAYRAVITMSFLKSLNLFKTVGSLLTSNVRNFNTSQIMCELRTLTRCRVVDNSNLGKQAMLEGKPPKVIHIYKKGKSAKGTIGDKVLVAIKGLKKKAFIVGVVKHQKMNIPKFDSNNIVLLDDHGNPLGTRVMVPIPSMLRGKKEFAKVVAISTRFV